jgi:hypothetical protein
MKRALMPFAAIILILSAPGISRTQYSATDDEGTAGQYSDSDDAQALKIVSYALAPVGYMLEWTVTRPLYYAATDTPLAPMLSGDTQGINFFGETDRASQLPAGTFTPFQVSPYANTLLNSTPPAGTAYTEAPLPPVQTERTPYYPGGQSAPPGTGSAATPPGQAVLH